MAEMEDKINSILSDPGMMQKIMSMAQALDSGPPSSDPPSRDVPSRTDSGFPEIDLTTIQRLSGLAKQANVDKREQALLRALGAYLSSDRLSRLEKAMRAAKMAKIATSALNQRGISTFQGR